MWRSALRLSRLPSRQHIYQHVRLPLLPPLAAQHLPTPLTVRREYSSQSPRQVRVLFFKIPNLFIWLRTRVYFFFIQAYLDRDFRIDEFTEGATQAFSFVSHLLSQCKFDALEDLVASEILKELKDKCTELSETYRKALAVKSNEIMYSIPGDVGIYYDDNGRKFVSILMRFWYLKHIDLPDGELEGTKIFQMVFGKPDLKETKRILTANYEFHREFTKGVKPDWIITRIEHSKLLK